ncbi:MAG TPA: protocatechuate 3,4-dioxygenase subunit alpha [Myxococcales bacterium]|jgi:protocatechuate 3,4-dioxygenase alpha subunit|nr:protocatechuate 3,4-dioxygenase subunit alpha [Myxococcales bacterium]
MAARPVTPSQTVGPFFHFALERAGWNDLTRGDPRGERIVIEGRVLDGEQAPCDDALLEIWQANAAGRYAHPDDPQPEELLDPGFTGFGRALTDASGRYRFVTIRPGRVPGPGRALQAPHVSLTVFARGLLRGLATRIYFADEPSNADDPVLSSIADPAARRTLLALRQPGPEAIYRFDLVLQGEGETAFFEL